MAPQSRLPSTPEIKSVINAARMAGMTIGMIEIEPGRIRILAASPDTREPETSAYDRWKATQIEED